MIRADWIERWASYYPDKTAVREFETGRELTYRELDNLARYAALFLQKEFQVSHGDRIAILAENCLEYFVLFSVAQKTGCILVPLNYRLAPAELEYMLNDSDPVLCITEKKFADKLPSFRGNLLELESFTSFIWKKKGREVEPVPRGTIREDDPLFILYTSGTTGYPKGAIYTHKMLFWNSINTGLRLDITSDDHSVSCTPMFHTGGWNVIPTPFLHHGASVTLMRKFDPDQVLELLEKEQASMFMAVPTMLQLMAKSPLFDRVVLKSMRFFVIGGEPMPIPLIELWHRKGIPVRQGYGLTEAGPSITSLHQKDAVRKMGSIGTPNFYLEIRIAKEDGTDAERGEVGELLLRGPVVTPGYWGNEQATREAFSGDWFHTGDLVRMDSEGYLFIVDRKKNMYISGGENVYPVEVEKELLKHPAVEEVAIIGVPDEKWGEVGMAFVVLKKGHQADEGELHQFLIERIAKYKIPKYFRFVPELPRSDTGKIDRKALRQLTN